MSGHLLRVLLPGKGRLLLALTLLVTPLASAIHFLERLPRAEREETLIVAALASAMLWWLLMAGRLGRLACAMPPLLLPGTGRLLGAGLVLYMLPVLAAFLLALPWVGATLDVFLFAGALLLGSALGMLLLSLPHALWWLAIVLPQAAQHLCWPTTALGYWGGTGGVLCAVMLLWRWYCSPVRSANWWWQPQVLLMDSAIGQGRATSSALDRHVGEATREDNRALAAVLGAPMQTFRQRYRWRGRLASGAFLGSCLLILLILLALEPENLHRFMLVGGAPVLLALSSAFNAQWLASAQGRAALDELFLLPGLPRGQALLRALCRQALLVQGERLLLLGVVVVPVAWHYGFPLPWLQWFVVWSLLMLAVEMAHVLLVVAGWRDRWRWGLSALVLCAGLTMSAWLLFAGCWPSSAVLAAWGVPVIFLLLAPLLLWWRLRYSPAPLAAGLPA